MPDLAGFGDWLLTALLYVPRKIYELFTDSAIELINAAFALCSSCDASGVNTALAAMPQAVMFILSWFKLGSGLTIIVSAYTVRFLIRRIPGVG